MIDYLNDVVAAHWRDWYATAPPVLDWLLLTNGGTALHDNVIFLGTPPRARQPLLVAKVCRKPDYGHTIEAEFGQLTAVWQQLGQQAIGRIPRPLHLGRLGADPVLLTDFFAGPLLTDRLRLTADDPTALARLLQQAAVWLRLLHEQTVQPLRADLSIPYDCYLAQFASLFRLTTREKAGLEKVQTAVAAHTHQATSQLLQHGDFWPGNIVLRAADEQLALIDWQFSTWTSDASFDLYFLLLASAAALARRGTAAERGQQVGRRLADWLPMVLPAYLAAYGQPMQYALLPPDIGLLLACAVAVARPVATFGVLQDDAPLWRAAFAALVEINIGEVRV